jgi:hypothetical protein
VAKERAALATRMALPVMGQGSIDLVMCAEGEQVNGILRRSWIGNVSSIGWRNGGFCRSFLRSKREKCELQINTLTHPSPRVLA